MKIAFGRNTAIITFVFFLVGLITFWAYYESTNNKFVWDSIPYLVHHWFFISNITLDNLVWMFLSLEVSNWHPLTWLSWAIDFQIYGGLVPAGFHLTSIILHSINSALFFILMLVVFGLNNPPSGNFPFRTDNNAVIAAFLAALLFAIHPQHVESVVWVAERKDLLCQLFMQLSILAYVKYVTAGENGKSRWFNLTLFLYFLAVLSKPMAVTFPVVLLIIDIYPLRRSSLIQTLNHAIRLQTPYQLVREKLPFFLLSFILVLITLHAQSNALIAVPLDLRILNACNSVVLYLSKLLLPLHFAPHYPFFVNVEEAVSFKDYLPLLGVLVITWASLYAWLKGHHVWLIAWLFYLITLSPVLGLIQVGQQGAADRYAYFTTLPAYFLAGAGILVLLNKLTLTKQVLTSLAVLAVIVLLNVKLQKQIQVWSTPLSLWSHAVEQNLETVKARHNLGIANFHQQNYEQALFNFDRSLTMEGEPHSSLAWRGLTYILLNENEKALEDYLNTRKLMVQKPFLKLDPQCNFFNTGWLYAQLGDREKSATYFKKVGAKSELLPNANLWLSWLEKTDHNVDRSQHFEDLPDFCYTIGVF